MNEHPLIAKPSKTPLLLSTLVCPGLGQMVQGRWIAAFFYFISFLSILGGLLFMVISFLYSNLQKAITLAQTGTSEPFDNLSPKTILLPFFFAMLIYTLNVFDVFFAHKKRPKKPMKTPLYASNK